MRFIPVIAYDGGEKIYVNADMVSAVYPHYLIKNASVIEFLGDEEKSLKVSGNPDTIINMMERGVGGVDNAYMSERDG